MKSWTMQRSGKKKQLGMFDQIVVPQFEIIRIKNLSGKAPWTYPPGTVIDEDGRPVLKEPKGAG